MSPEASAVELALHPDQLADLRQSGLADEIIAAAGLRSLAPAEFSKYLGPRLAAKVQSVMLFPYPGTGDFYRVKLFPAVSDGDGHTIRYYQPAGTAPRLYLPPRARAVLADPSISILISEGEKKVLKADQSGLACVGLGGLWSWLLDGQPIQDLGSVDWCERNTTLAPDSDVWTRPDLLQPMYALGRELEARGAKVTVLKLPAGGDGGKTGLDDYLVHHQVDDLQELPRLDLKHAVWTKTAEWYKGWRKKKAAEDDPGDPSAPGAPIVLADAEPWPVPVDGTALLDAIRATIRRYVVLSDEAAIAAALWLVHTHAEAAAAVSPILAIISPTKQCGKTFLLTVLGALARRPLPTANITSASLFRVVEGFAPTLLIDEADTFLRENEELRGILNSGHFRATAVVIRTINDDHEPRVFSTWCPKAIALIGRLPDTLEARSIVLPLRRKAPGEKVARLRLSQLLAEGLPLRRQAARWVGDHLGPLRVANPEALEELNDRQNDSWGPLLALADLAGGPWPEKARQAARTLAGQVEDQAVGVLLLEDIKSIYTETAEDRLTTASLIEKLVAMEERPWCEWKHGRPLTPRGLSRLLEPFGVHPKQIRVGVKTLKGYVLEDLEDAFSRYLPLVSETAKQNNNDAELDQNHVRNTPPNVSDGEGDLRAREIGDVSDVSDRNPGEEGEEGSWTV